MWADRIRRASSWLLGSVGQAAQWVGRREGALYRQTQGLLRQHYGVGPDTPILGYGPELVARHAAFLDEHPDAQQATTSGSTAEPKRIPYTAARLKSYKITAALATLRSFPALGLTRPDVFVLATVAEDDSFTSLVLGRRGTWPRWRDGVFDPGQYLRHPDLVALQHRFGVTAVRLWLWVVAQPAVLYATNPSTLAVFLDEVQGDWQAAVTVVRGHARRDPSLPLATLDEVVQRTGVADHARRLDDIGALKEAPPFSRIGPSLQGFACWDGGYVGVFLTRIRRWLPADRYVHVPMFSMSTEVMQTVPYVIDDAVHFVPMAPGVYYEFLPEGADDDPSLLLAPWELEVDRRYTMVASNAYGLLRYQTEDVFRCVAMVGDLPDLRFERRRGLTWSFTGEKLTGEQVQLAFEAAVAEAPELAGDQLTLVPCRTLDGPQPGYRLVAASSASVHPLAGQEARGQAIAAVFESALSDANDEFASKRKSGRLAPTRFVIVPYDRLAEALDRRTQTDAQRAERAWDAQFKLLPLTRTVWEDMELPV